MSARKCMSKEIKKVMLNLKPENHYYQMQAALKGNLIHIQVSQLLSMINLQNHEIMLESGLSNRKYSFYHISKNSLKVSFVRRPNRTTHYLFRLIGQTRNILTLH
ncbi:protein of unknown function [Maridesulfovibrio hydrothermalis AM13 = DSM 14728]|uniref:Uncharacterized protein n=1 Tax=Maridesulfovibrio hydrothermalis AM13 = DSM 14728 TaxID=1121451 RepID=L0RC94_9BACT|nr:protein of unknown function [Maridesulfovibrio hydrothermalis AM13 = DSM 14728]